MKKTMKKAEGKVTAASVVRQLLVSFKGTNEELVAEVNERTGKEGFNLKQLAWYRSQWKHGKLKGMPKFVAKATKKATKKAAVTANGDVEESE